MKEADVKWIAAKLETAVGENPYLFVPQSGPKSGALGLNYSAIVIEVLKIASEVEK